MFFCEEEEKSILVVHYVSEAGSKLIECVMFHDYLDFVTSDAWACLVAL